MKKKIKEIQVVSFKVSLYQFKIYPIFSIQISVTIFSTIFCLPIAVNRFQFYHFGSIRRDFTNLILPFRFYQIHFTNYFTNFQFTNASFTFFLSPIVILTLLILPIQVDFIQTKNFSQSQFCSFQITGCLSSLGVFLFTPFHHLLSLEPLSRA